MAGQSHAALKGVDFAQKMDWFSKSDCPKGDVFQGKLTALQLQDGFGLHTLNATASRHFEVDNQRRAGAVLHCFLEGQTEAWLEDIPMNLGRAPGAPVKLVLTSIQEPLRFRRRSRPNEYARKISIQMSHDWMDQNALSLPQSGLTKGTERFEWLATFEEVQTLEKLAQSSDFNKPLSRLHAQSLALEVVARAFGTLANQPAQAGLNRREQTQLRRIDEFLRAPGPLPSLQTLAAVGGVSQSSLRRLMHSAYGCAPLSYARRIRLEMSRTALENDQISVQSAAYMAGYTTATSFTTAFRKYFGAAPSQVRRKKPR